jgi:AcrR family transcriptional regulator
MTKAPQAPRIRDADRTRKSILAGATEEFAAHGYGGARIDAIAERTSNSKRMIFHYFGDKEGLYRAALEAAYADIRGDEANLRLNELAPVDALRRLVEYTFDYDESHPAFVRLVTSENLQGGRFLAQSEAMRSINASALIALTDLLARGRREGVFTREIDPLDLHLMISALCFFRVSNRSTFGVIFDVDLGEETVRARHKHLIVETALTWVGAQTTLSDQAPQA